MVSGGDALELRVSDPGGEPELYLPMTCATSFAS
jgi:hypothetical protein